MEDIADILGTKKKPEAISKTELTELRSTQVTPFLDSKPTKKKPGIREVSQLVGNEAIPPLV